MARQIQNEADLTNRQGNLNAQESAKEIRAIIFLFRLAMIYA
jgi:hypothetical protein